MMPGDIAAAADRHFDALMDAADQAADETERAGNDAGKAIWRTLAQSPDDAVEWIDAHHLEFCHGEQAFGRLAHFAAFMQQHGPLDAAALAAIGARVVAEMETIIAPAALQQADKFMERAE